MTRQSLRIFLVLIVLAGTALASLHTEGAKTVLVLVSQYPDELITKTEAQLQADFDFLFKIGQSGGIDDYYRRNSYGKTWFTSVTVRKVTLPNPKASYSGNYGLVLTQALSIAGISSSAYDRTMSVAAGTISSTGLAYVGGRFSFYNNIQSAAVIAHELGHNWGNWHANFWKPNGTDPLDGSYLEYGNSFDNMGGGSGEWNGVKKAGLDFLTANATDGTRLLDVSTTGTYRLAALDSAAPAPGLARALRLARSGTTGGSAPRLFIDYRQVQYATNPYSWNGVHLYLDFGGSMAENLIDTTPQTPPPGVEVNDAPLVIGHTFHDPGANAFITPLAKVPASNPPQIDVRINFGPVTGNNAPSVTISANNTIPAPGTAITLAAAASDPDSDPLAYAWDFGDGTFSSDPAAVQTKSYPAAGWYRVACTVTDMRGGTATNATWINAGSNPYRAPDSSATLGGVAYRYYEGSFSTLPDFGKLLPKKSGSLATVSLSPKERSDGFAFLFEGFLDVPATEVYTLAIKGDDGFRLFIGDSLLINSNSVKSAAQTVAANIGLQAGKHPFRLEFFHKDGAEDLVLTWQTANSAPVEIPASGLHQTDFGANAAPSVVITAPAPGFKVVVGSSVQFLADAFDADGIARVQFFSGGSFLGESTSAPFQATWNDIPVGPKTITALACDTTGRWSASAPLDFEVVSPEPRQSIGLNFNPLNSAGASLDWSDIAGAVYPQGNWNNFTGISGNATNQLDSLGNNSGVAVAWRGSANSHYVSTTSISNADTSTAPGKLMRGVLVVRHDETGYRPTATVSAIPFREYDVCVYFDQLSTLGDSNITRFTLTPAVGTAPAPIFGRNSAGESDGLGDYPNYDTWIGFKESTAASASAPADQLFGNYVVFRGVRSPAFTVVADTPTGANGRVGFNAIQIVESIPDSPRLYLPTTTAALAEGGPAEAYSIALGFPPTGNVAIAIFPDAQLSADKSTLVFTPENWATPQFVNLRAVDDTVGEASPHTGVVTHGVWAAGTNYDGLTLPALTASITDNDEPAIIVESDLLPAHEGVGPTSAGFTITRTGSANLDATVTVNFTMSKPATAGADLTEYTLSGNTTVTYNNATGTGSIVIPAWQSHARVLLTPVNDTTVEVTEFAALTLAAGSGYRLGSPAAATLAIRDDDRRDWLTQYFASGQIDTTFDLAGKKLSFHPDPSGPANAPYHVTISNASTFPTPTTGHVSLRSTSTHPLTGNFTNGYWTVSSGHPVKFFGQTYNTIYIGVDGWLRLSSPDSTGTWGLTHHWPKQEIAAFFSLLDANPAGADVLIGRVTSPGQERTVVTWSGLWRATWNSDSKNQVSFQIECWDDGTISISWPVVGSNMLLSSNYTIVGLANNDGSPADPATELNNFSTAAATPLHAPVFNTVPSSLATVGTPYIHDVSASAATGGTPDLTAPVLPAWLALTVHSNGAATLSGTPTAPGSYAVTLRATGSSAATDQSFVIVAEPAGGNVAPVFTSAPPATAFVPGAEFLYFITATDTNNTIPAISAVRLPSWLALTDHGNGTATIAGTVPDTAIARFDVELAADDGIATTAQAFAIALDRPPVATVHSPARRAIGLPDRNDTLVIEASALDPEGAPVTAVWSVLSAPVGGQAVFGNASTASTEATFSAPGRYRLRLSASDATSTGTADLDVFVESNGTTDVLSNALLGYWPVSETANLTTVADTSGNNRTLALGSGLDAVIVTGGVSGNAASFTGNTNSFAENTAITQTAKTSVSFWLRPAASPAPAEQTVVNINNGGTPRLRVYRQASGSRLRVTAAFGSTSGVWEITGDIPAAQWTHVVVAYDYASTAANPVAYLNGSSATVTRITAPSGALQSMGNRIRLGEGAGARLVGALDEVRVYQELVSGGEVTALYNRTNERTANLAGYWKFDEAVGSTLAVDDSGNNRNLVLGSGIAALTTTAGYAGNGINLNAANLSYAQASVTQPNQTTVALWFRVGTSPSATEANLWTLLNGAASRLRVYRPANERRLLVAAHWGTTTGVWRIERDIPANQWQHLAVAYDRGSVSNTPAIYLDGQPVPLTTIAAPAGAQQTAATVLRLGADGNANNRWFGCIDEIRLHNRLVPADEIPLLMLPNGINQAPDVDAGASIEIAANSTITLAGQATDDGQPAASAAVTFQWTLLSGPSGSALGSPTSPDSIFTTGPAPGLYTLRLTATDGEATVLQNTTVGVPAPPSAFGGWISTQSGIGSATGPNDDPDGDGLSNLLEYALGGDPGIPASAALPIAQTTAVSGQPRLALDFTPAQTAGLRYIIEASPDLSDWSDQFDITSLLQEGRPYRHTDSANLSTTQRRFLRLRVTME